jgi:flagellar assembly protein FliH
MAAAAKFLFDVDFAAGAAAAEKPVAHADHQRKLAEAESKGFKDGYATGERDAVAEAERRKAAAYEQIGDALGRMVRGLEAVENRLEAEAVEVAVAVGRKLAPELIAEQPFAEIEALAIECFRQLHNAPHVVVRVNDALHETARTRLDEIARLRGFEGRLVILAEPQIALGDCRIEWADGGVTRDRAGTDAAIAEATARYVAARRAAAGLGAPEQHKGGPT